MSDGAVDQDLILKLATYFNRNIIDGTNLNRETLLEYLTGDELLDLQMQLHWLQDALKTYVLTVLPEQGSGAQQVKLKLSQHVITILKFDKSFLK